MLSWYRSRRGFTLLELIVVIVILGILATLAVPTFYRAIERSRDEVAGASLSSVARDAQALSAFNQNGFEASSVTAAINETRGRSASAGQWASEAQTFTPVTTGSDAYGKVDWALSAQADQLGLAMKSSTGRCVYIKAGVTGSTKWTVSTDKPALCDAEFALTGNPGGNGGGGTGGGSDFKVTMYAYSYYSDDSDPSTYTEDVDAEVYSYPTGTDVGKDASGNDVAPGLNFSCATPNPAIDRSSWILNQKSSMGGGYWDLYDNGRTTPAPGGREYTCTATASDSSGKQLGSVTYTVKVDGPRVGEDPRPVPAALTPVATPGDSEVSLSWDAPDFGTGDPFYVVNVSNGMLLSSSWNPNSGLSWYNISNGTTLTGGLTSLTIPGLTNRTLYTFTVTAYLDSSMWKDGQNFTEGSIMATPGGTTGLAVNDSATTISEWGVEVPVVNNDTNVGAVTGVTQPAHGTSTVVDVDTVRYASNAGFTGVDTFTYQTSSGASATVSITVGPLFEPCPQGSCMTEPPSDPPTVGNPPTLDPTNEYVMGMASFPHSNPNPPHYIYQLTKSGGIYWMRDGGSSFRTGWLYGPGTFSNPTAIFTGEGPGHGTIPANFVNDTIFVYDDNGLWYTTVSDFTNGRMPTKLIDSSKISGQIVSLDGYQCYSGNTPVSGNCLWYVTSTFDQDARTYTETVGQINVGTHTVTQIANVAPYLYGAGSIHQAVENGQAVILVSEYHGGEIIRLKPDGTLISDISKTDPGYMMGSVLFTDAGEMYLSGSNTSGLWYSPSVPQTNYSVESMHQISMDNMEVLGTHQVVGEMYFTEAYSNVVLVNGEWTQIFHYKMYKYTAATDSITEIF